MKSLILLAIFVTSSAFAEDARMFKPDVRACVETAKSYSRASEYSNVESEQELIGACRDVEGDCVLAVAGNMRSSERYEKDQMLPIVRACRGRGMAKCYRNMIAGLASYDYSTKDQALALLKKCE